jgi:membrane-bound serine protease (ClpP class)
MNTLERITLMVRLAINARRTKMRPNAIAIVGLTGRAETAIGDEGTVFVRGELWRARSRANVSRGENVRVIGVEGLTLNVKEER